MTEISQIETKAAEVVRLIRERKQVGALKKARSLLNESKPPAKKLSTAIEAAAALALESGFWEIAGEMFRAIEESGAKIGPHLLIFADLLHKRGLIRQANQRFLTSLRVVEASLASKPDHVGLLISKASILRRLQKIPTAAHSLQLAACLEPGSSEAYLGFAALCYQEQRLFAAKVMYRRALTLEPANADTHWLYAFALLADGNFEAGFAEYEWRWKRLSVESRPRDFAVPEWDGGGLQGKSLLIHGEQAIGDAIQFLRFVPGVRNAIGDGARVILEIAEPLLPLAKCLDGVDCLVPARLRGEGLPDFDTHIPLISLPRVLGIKTPEMLGGGVPYLRVDAPNKLTIPERDPAKLAVGFLWGSNPDFFEDGYRSASIADMTPLFDVAGVQLFCLQKGKREKEAVQLPNNIIRLNERIADASFEATARAIAQMDLVISPCTSTAHLAGALGVPCWLFLGKVADWRWMTGREDSPWYRSIRLFRQARFGDWKSVFNTISDELQKLSENRA